MNNDITPSLADINAYLNQYDRNRRCIASSSEEDFVMIIPIAKIRKEHNKEFAKKIRQGKRQIAFVRNYNNKRKTK